MQGKEDVLDVDHEVRDDCRLGHRKLAGCQPDMKGGQQPSGDVAL